MDIEEKVNVFEESCKKLLSFEISQINRSINNEIEKQIKDEIEEYQEKEELTYNKKQEKLEKDYNKKIYSLEMDAKKEVLNQKKLIKKELKKEVKNALIAFTDTPEYKEFLFKKIDETISKLKNTKNSVLFLTEKDKKLYSDEIHERYGLDIQLIDNKYIGGCVLEDKIQGLYIDNTIQNSINEKLDD